MLSQDHRQLLDAAFHQHRAKLRRCVELRMDHRVRGRLDPSDVLQEAFIDLLAKYPRYQSDPQIPLYVWMRLVTMERLLKLHRRHLKTEKRQANREVPLQANLNQEATSVQLAAQLMAQLTSQGQRAIRKETQAQLLQVLEGLDPMDREVIFLRNFEELSNQETAATLQLSKTAASNRYIRALKRLREALKNQPLLSGIWGGSQAG